MKPIDVRARWGVAVYVLLRDSRGRVLLLRRSKTRSHFPGCWELPGGKPEPGEPLDRTADLEVSEETGLYVKPTRIAGASECTLAGMHIALIFFEARAPRTEVTLSPEHDDHCWLSLKEALSLRLRPGFKRFLAEYLGRPRRR